MKRLFVILSGLMAILPAFGQSDTSAIAKLIGEGTPLEYSDPHQSLKLYDSAYVIALKTENKNWIAKCLSKRGVAYIEIGNYDSASVIIIRSIKMQDELGDLKGLATNLNNLGNVYYYSGDYPKAILYHKESMGKELELKNPQGAAYSALNVGIMYDDTGEPDSAMWYYQYAKDILLEINDTFGLAYCYNSMGVLQQHLNSYQAALEYFELGLEKFKEARDLKGMAGSYISIADLHLILQHPKSALPNLIIADTIIERHTKSLPQQKNLYKSFHEYYKMVGQFDQALRYHERYFDINDSLRSEEKINHIDELEAEFQNERKTKEIELLNKDKALTDVKIQKQKQYSLFLVLILIATGVILFVVVWSYLQKRKTNVLLQEQNHLIGEQYEELNQQNEEIMAISDKLESQNATLTRQHEDIVSSITYAKRIQEAILPTNERILELLPESFVYYQPKDIVSGDFYWFEQVGNKVLWAAVDCTGHGVPGAFMSILGFNGLKKIVLEGGITDPATILSQLSEHVMGSFTATKSGDTLKDGMDMALCCLDRDTRQLQFCGAYNPLYLIRNGALEQYKGARRPVGFSFKNHPGDFQNHTIQLEKGDWLYTFTDGYADQFGGAKESKFSYRQLRELLIEYSSQPPEIQLEKLHKSLKQWRGSGTQIDDVCVIGVSIS